jgi:hypothetical protein
MADTTQQSAAGAVVQSYIHTTEIVERPAAERPLRDSLDALLIGSWGARYKLRRVRKRLTNSLGGYSPQAFRLRD